MRLGTNEIRRPVNLDIVNMYIPVRNGVLKKNETFKKIFYLRKSKETKSEI